MIQDVKFLIINGSYFSHLLLVKPFVAYLHYFLGSIADANESWQSHKLLFNFALKAHAS
jgi:hypothetical protein